MPSSSSQAPRAPYVRPAHIEAKRKRSQSAYDPDLLFFLYARSQAHWSDFLAAANLLTTATKTLALTKWKPRLRATIAALAEDNPMVPIYTATLDALPGQAKFDTPALTRALRETERAPEPNPVRELVPELPSIDTLRTQDPQATFTALREQQWLVDYMCAHALREYTMHRLRTSYDPHTNTPLMSPQELKHTSAILRDIQAIQRLTLNQSTENIDLPSKPPTDEELSNTALAQTARRHIHKALQSGNLAAAKFIIDATPASTSGPTPNVRVVFSDAPEIKESKPVEPESEPPTETDTAA